MPRSLAWYSGSAPILHIIVGANRGDDVTAGSSQADRGRSHEILEATTDLVAIADPDGTLRSLNGGGRVMLRLAPDEPLHGTTLASVCAPDALNDLTHALALAARDGVWRGRGVLAPRTGRRIPVSQVVLGRRSPDGRLDYYAVIARDMSLRRGRLRPMQRCDRRPGSSVCAATAASTQR